MQAWRNALVSSGHATVVQGCQRIETGDEIFLAVVVSVIGAAGAQKLPGHVGS